MSISTERPPPNRSDISCLPDEILHQIMSHLVLDICDYFKYGSVCSRWYQIVKLNKYRIVDSTKWTILKLDRVYAILGDHYYPPLSEYKLLVSGSGGIVARNLISCVRGQRRYSVGNIFYKHGEWKDKVVVTTPQELDCICDTYSYEPPEYYHPYFNFLDCNRKDRRRILGDYDLTIYDSDYSSSDDM